MDNELFDLCKQVYEKTGWRDTLDYQWMKEDLTIDNQRGTDTGVKGGWWYYEYIEGQVPLYDSDYLLEKLPSVVQDTDDKIFRVITMWINGDGSTHAGYAEPYAHDDKYAHSQTSDRMVNTLLKLTLALSEAGEL